MIAHIRKERPKDIGRACRVMSTSRSSMNYLSVLNDQPLEEKLQKLAQEHPQEGFWKYFFRLRNTGEEANHKRVYRVYRKMELPMRRKTKKRLPKREKAPLAVPPTFTHTWSIDFMSDALVNGKKFRTFNIIDDFNREVLFVEIDYSLKSNRVIWVLNHLIKRYGKPAKIRMDNGPEFVATISQKWSEGQRIDFQYIQPGKPMQNGYVERFNGIYRKGVLDAYAFNSLEEVREITDQWMYDYNYERPHESLGNISPVQYRQKAGEKCTPSKGLRSAPATPPLHSAPLRNIGV